MIFFFGKESRVSSFYDLESGTFYGRELRIDFERLSLDFKKI